MGIKRAKRDRWVLGVCGGVAHHFGWNSNSNTVRLVTAILAILIPGPSLVATILVYVLLGYLLPETETY
jgi:phage shock protein C